MKYNIGWGLTNCCNMNCQFCYSKETRKKLDNKNLSDWISFIDSNHDMIETINYGTGENVILDEFFCFIKYVRDNYPSIKQSLTTNGFLYERVSKNDNFYNIYKDCIDEVDVSLDFYDKEKHSKFRGQSKAYDWAINTLKMLKKDKKLATIVFVGFENTLTEDNIDGLFKIAKEFDALIRLNIYRPVSEDDFINNKFIVSYNTLKNALEYMMKKYDIVSLSDILFGNLYTEGTDIKENTGLDSIRILPNGDICPSTYLISNDYRNKYNISDEKVLENIKFKGFINPPIPKECNDCSLKEKCRGGVYDRRILWYNSFLERDPYCPLRNNDDVIKEKIRIKKKERVSVHDGYLPTMFFKN